jgi:hypothetical protein
LISLIRRLFDRKKKKEPLPRVMSKDERQIKEKAGSNWITVKGGSDPALEVTLNAVMMSNQPVMATFDPDSGLSIQHHHGTDTSPPSHGHDASPSHDCGPSPSGDGSHPHNPCSGEAL